MSKEDRATDNAVDATNLTTEPAQLRVSVDLGGKTVGQFELPAHEDADHNARNLASLLAEVGNHAVYSLYGKEAMTKFGTYLFAIPPPAEERLQYEQVYVLLSNILNEKTSATGWSWEERRLDGTVKFTKVDNTGKVIDTIDGSAYINTWVDCIRANYHGCNDGMMSLATALAAYGIPYRTTEASAERIGGPLPMIPHSAALAQKAILKAAIPLLSHADMWKAGIRCELLDTQAEADPLTDGVVDNGPKEVKVLVSGLRLHPVRARRLATALRTSPDKVALLADALEAEADNHRGSQETICITPPRPEWESYFNAESERRALSDKELADIKARYLHDLTSWRKRYGKVGPKRSNNLVRRAIGAMNFKWTGHGDADDAAYNVFEKRFNGDSEVTTFRMAIRPWEGSKKFVEVGNTKFGKLPKASGGYQPLRQSDTPNDLYRLLYLTQPVSLNFDDMYGQGLFGIVSPCGRFAMSFYLHKYELAAYQYVKKELAVRTREERGPFRIQCGIPGVDNGVGTIDKDAARWFKMVSVALGREWCVYGGNDFNV